MTFYKVIMFAFVHITTLPNYDDRKSDEDSITTITKAQRPYPGVYSFIPGYKIAPLLGKDHQKFNFLYFSPRPLRLCDEKTITLNRCGKE